MKLSKKAALLLFCAFLFSFCGSAAASEIKLFEIEIPMEKGAAVTVTDRSGTIHNAGTVELLPVKTRWPSYTASSWSTQGTVCASAVNAIHMLVSVEKDKGRTMSIIPIETIAPAAGAGASVVISPKAGESIFGAWTPTVGSKVFVRKSGGELFALSPETLPKPKDTLVITVYEDRAMPYMVDIENRPGGRVTAWTSEGYEVLARVIKPIKGTGRFEGTLFQRTGAIRANHSGVIDISTTPRGVTGGFQIIPWDHALTSKEMQGAWDMSQWLIIGPSDGKSMMGGTPPLFKNALVPGPASGEKLWDVWSTYGRKSLILARYGNGGWQTLDETAGRNDSGLKDITGLRIYYPFTEEVQKSK